jgi:hypothetical protein
MCGEDKFDSLRVQSAALPTELPGHIEPHDKFVKKRNYSKNADFYRLSICLRPSKTDKIGRYLRVFSALFKEMLKP